MKKAGRDVGDKNTANPAENKIEATLQAHSVPRWNALDEPWLPVARVTGEVETVNLRVLLNEAHLISDLAETEPLTRAALRRFLEDITAAIILNSSELDYTVWENSAASNSGFPEGAVDSFSEKMYDFFYAYHPAHPFLQDIRLATVLPERGQPDAPISALLPHLPGDSESAWSYKPGDPAMNVDTFGLTIAETLRSILTRRNYSLLGNGGGGDRGGTFSEGPATITNVFRVYPGSLYRTILRNLTPALLAQPAQEGQPSGLAWLHPQYEEGGDALYQSSLTVAQSLLGPEEEGRINFVLRRSLGDKDQDKIVRDAARDIDRHAIVTITSKGPIRRRIKPEEHPTKRLHTLINLSPSGDNPTTGVLIESNLWLTDAITEDGEFFADQETLELLLASKAGQASSPKYSHVTTVHVPALYLQESWSHQQLIATILSESFADRGPYMKLRGAMKNAMDGEARLREAIDMWMDEMSHIVTKAETNQIDNEQARVEPYLAALKAYDTATAPLAGQARSAARIAKARRRLTIETYPQKGNKTND